MPVPPQPFKLTCPKCGWSRTIVPTSDVIFPHESPNQNCPKCGASDLEKTRASGAGRVGSLLGKYLRGGR